MNRTILIQAIIDKANFKTYLEIGSRKGKSFFPVRCKRKVAIDPVFLIRKGRKLKWVFRNPCNIRSRYFQETSQDFFANRKAFISKFAPIDVALIDGLHTYRGALHDVMETLKYLNKDGIIIMHDCYPPHEAAALPTETFPTEEEQKSVEGWNREWCGDVWKSIVYLKENHSDLLDVSVIDTDYGLGIVRLKKPFIGTLELNQQLLDSIDKLTYKELIAEPEKLVNLTHVDKVPALIAEFA